MTDQPVQDPAMQAARDERYPKLSMSMCMTQREYDTRIGLRSGFAEGHRIASAAKDAEIGALSAERDLYRDEAGTLANYACDLKAEVARLRGAVRDHLRALNAYRCDTRINRGQSWTAAETTENALAELVKEP